MVIPYGQTPFIILDQFRFGVFKFFHGITVLWGDTQNALERENGVGPIVGFIGGYTLDVVRSHSFSE